jgi:hypothetical protein
MRELLIFSMGHFSAIERKKLLTTAMTQMHLKRLYAEGQHPDIKAYSL